MVRKSCMRFPHWWKKFLIIHFTHLTKQDKILIDSQYSSSVLFPFIQLIYFKYLTHVLVFDKKVWKCGVYKAKRCATLHPWCCSMFFCLKVTPMVVLMTTVFSFFCKASEIQPNWGVQLGMVGVQGQLWLLGSGASARPPPYWACV